MFNKIDKLVRVMLLAVLAGLVGGNVVACCTRSVQDDNLGPNVVGYNKPLVINNGQTQQLPDTNYLLSTLGMGIGLTTPAHELQIDSTAACTGNIPDSACLPVVITEFAAAAPSVVFRAAGGTQSAPVPLAAAGNFIGQLRGQPYTTTGFQGLPQVFLELANAEPGSPTVTAQGTYLQLRTTPIGSVNSAGALKIDSTGNVAVGLSFDNETVPFGFVDLTSVAFAAIMQPVALGNNATVNNYSPVDSLGPVLTMQNTFALRVVCTGTNIITGMTDALGQTSKNGVPFGFLGGREVAWINIGSGTCTFPSENTGSLAKNRYVNPGGQTLVCPPNSTVNFFSDEIQDSTVGRWRAIGTTGCHYELAPTSVSHGALGAGSSNEQGNVTGIGGNTSVILTYSVAYLNNSWCTATPNGTGTIEVIAVTNSITAPTFSCFNTTTGAGANCVDFTYRCGGN